VLGAGGGAAPGGKTSSSFASAEPLGHAEDSAEDSRTMAISTRGALELTSSPHEHFSGLGAIGWSDNAPHLHGFNEAGGAVIAHLKAAL